MMIMRCKTLLAAFLVAATIGGVFPSSAWADPVLRIYAAGSLKGVLGEAAGVFTAREGIAVKTSFGPSGDFARTAAGRRGGRSVRLRRLGPTPGPGRFGTGGETGDFRQKPGLRPGPGRSGHDPGQFSRYPCCARISGSAPRPRKPIRAATTLGSCSIAPRSCGRAVSPCSTQGRRSWSAAPNRRNRQPVGRLWTYLMEQADVFLLYCNSAKAALEQVPGASIVQPPPELAVIPEYGASVLTHGDRPTAAKFLAFLQSQEGRTLLTKWGFSIP